jgi:hypothetical protein
MTRIRSNYLQFCQVLARCGYQSDRGRLQLLNMLFVLAMAGVPSVRVLGASGWPLLFVSFKRYKIA